MPKDHKDDLEFEPTDEAAAAAGEAGKLKQLRATLKQTEEKAREYLAGWQRARADYLNLQKNEAEQRQAASRRGAEQVLTDLIKVADSFDLAIGNETVWQSAPENWRQGIEYIYRELQNIFRDYNLEIIDPVGEKFNPLYHHAVGAVPAPTAEQHGQVAQVLQKGYKLGEKIIRPAQVKTYE